MVIGVRDVETCTWEWDGGSMWCTHDVVEEVDYATNYMTVSGPAQHSDRGPACVECGEPVDE